MRTLQRLCQTPAVQRQKNDVKHQYGRQVEHKRIGDEGNVAAYGNDAKVDHVLHGKCGQYQRRGEKPDFAGVRHDLRSRNTRITHPELLQRKAIHQRHLPKMLGGALPRAVLSPSGRHRAFVTTC